MEPCSNLKTCTFDMDKLLSTLLTKYIIICSLFLPILVRFLITSTTCDPRMYETRVLEKSAANFLDMACKFSGDLLLIDRPLKQEIALTLLVEFCFYFFILDISKSKFSFFFPFKKIKINPLLHIFISFFQTFSVFFFGLILILKLG